MARSYFNPTPLLLAFGLLAFVLAGLSIVYMFRSQPYDGVALDPESESGLVVREVVPGSGADKAGIRPGDEILGIDRNFKRDAAEVARALNRFDDGDEVLYLLRKPNGMDEVWVRIERRRPVNLTAVFSSALGFSFFLVGLFVLVRQPMLRASQVFFVLCGLFLIFLVCRMRLPSYGRIDAWIQNIGTLTFLFLPPTFFQFYLIFPRPVMLRQLARKVWWQRLRGLTPPKGTAFHRLGASTWTVIYLLPLFVFATSFVLAGLRGRELGLIHGAPAANWWLLAAYMLLGLVALGANARHLQEPRERRGVFFVLAGSLFGLVPFLVSSLVFSASLHSPAFFIFGVLPLVMVPITFTYAVVRFQLLDIRVILRRSLLYTPITALLTGFYAGGIVAFNLIFSNSTLVDSRWFPIILALAIVLLFEPLRRHMQELIDQYFYGDRSRLQKAMVELGEAMTAEVDLQAVVEGLVDRLPQILGLRFAALYLLRGAQADGSGGTLYRAAGPERLPERLKDVPELRRYLRKRGMPTRIDQLRSLPLRSSEVAELTGRLVTEGVVAVGALDSPRRPLGFIFLSEKERQIALESEELELLQGLLHQLSLALETSLLLEERTQQAELERELEIAASIQSQLLPDQLTCADGWQVAAICRPARIVGGDFFTELPGPGGTRAVAFGDVSGKSVSGALMMMAAHEALHALAMTQPEPSRLFTLTNQRVYGLGRRSFVALGYFGVVGNGRLSYLMAGQPPPLLRRADGSVSELPLASHRIPVGALAEGEYRALEIDLGPGDVVLGYSDGVTDSRSSTGEFFGTERLLRVLEEASGDPESIMYEVLAAVEIFTESGLQYDDLTLVAIGRQAESHS